LSIDKSKEAIGILKEAIAARTAAE
jgi:hypothetical protein